MRALNSRRTAAALAAACSVLFAFQFSWLATLIVQKWGGGISVRPSNALDLQTDLLFLLSIVLSVLATGVNDWGLKKSTTEFLRRLPMSLAMIFILAVALGAKSEAIRHNGSGARLVPWLDLVQATIWLTMLGGGIRIWHRHNGDWKSRPCLSRSIRWVMFVKLSGLTLLLIYQAALLVRGEAQPPWASAVGDCLYCIGMIAAWISYMERRAKTLWHGILGKDSDDCGPKV